MLTGMLSAAGGKCAPPSSWAGGWDDSADDASAPHIAPSSREAADRQDPQPSSTFVASAMLRFTMGRSASGWGRHLSARTRSSLCACD